MTLADLKALTVDPFEGSTVRRNLFYKLEGLVQEFLMQRVPAEFWVDGSFLTEEEQPGDIDIAIKVMDDVMQGLGPEQERFLSQVSSDHSYIDGLDVFVFAGYWIGHAHYGTELDDGHSRVVPTYGQLYGKGEDDWLKGIAVLALWENDVGLWLRT
jgi:hypothetical protein